MYLCRRLPKAPHPDASPLLLLPPHVLLVVLSHLSYSEVSAARAVCRELYAACGALLRAATSQMVATIDARLEVARQQLLARRRTQMLRHRSTLETLRSELRVMRASCRAYLCVPRGPCFPGGRLLDHLDAALSRLEDDLPEWSLRNDLSTELVYDSRRIYKSIRKQRDFCRHFGSMIVDLLDVLLDTNYDLTVTYDVHQDACRMQGSYTLGRCSFLWAPDRWGSDGSLTEDERLSVLEYFSMLAKYNNRLLLREEQYLQELDATSTQQSPLNLRKYGSCRTCVRRTRLSEDSSLIQEIYCQQAFAFSEMEHIVCKVDLTCPLEDAPLDVLESWQRIKTLLKRGYDVTYCLENDADLAQISRFANLPKSPVHPSKNSELVCGDTKHKSGTYQDRQSAADEDDSSFPTEKSTTDLGHPLISRSHAETRSIQVQMEVCIPVHSLVSEVHQVSFKDSYSDAEAGGN